MKKRYLILAVLLICATLLCSCFLEEDWDPTGGNTGEILVTYYEYEGDTAYLREVPVYNGRIAFDTLPTRAGYRFLGLFDAEEGGVMYLDPNGVTSIEITQSLMLYSHWEAVSYKLRLNAGEGVLDAATEMTVTHGSALTELPVPTLAANAFVGWYDESGNRYSEGGTVLSERQRITTDAYPFDENGILMLYAVYEERNPVVTFAFDGGREETLEIVYGEKIPAALLPVEDTGSREVIGWTETPGGTALFDGAVTGDLTLYPVWADYRTVIFNDGLGNRPEVKLYRDTVMDLTTYGDLFRPGYVVEGWYGSSTYSGNPMTTLTYGSAVTELYAKWEPAVYTMTFDAASAGTTINPIVYQLGDSMLLPTLERTGYRFLGWCTDEACAGVPLTAITPSTYGTYTLYASFEHIAYRITLDAQGGTLPAYAKDLYYGDSFTLDVPVRTGYTFLGWYTAIEGGNLFADATGKPLQGNYTYTQNTALYALWSPNRYTVTYESNGGTIISAQTYGYNEALRLPADPEKAGVIFAGWFDAGFATAYDSNTRVTSDLSLYAKWIQSTPISTAAELAQIAQNPSGNYHLVNDIGLGGAEWTSIPLFRGIFNGRGYRIYNFTMISDAQNSGFFAVNEGRITSLTLADFVVTARGEGGAAGVLCGVNKGTVQSCVLSEGVFDCMMPLTPSTGTVVKDFCGGIAGDNVGEIHACQVELNLRRTMLINWQGYISESTADTAVGLLAGRSSGIVDGCTANGSITLSWKKGITDMGNLTATIISGGAIGHLTGSVTKSRATVSTILASDDTPINTALTLGGFVGYNEGTASSCASGGTLLSESIVVDVIRAGGFVGRNVKSISNCYAEVAQNLKGRNHDDSVAGGFVGRNEGSVLASYAAGSITTDYAWYGRGGFAGTNVSTGSLNKCFSTVSIITPDNEKWLGTLCGVSEEGSLVYKCYYSDSAEFTKENGTVLTPGNVEGEIIAFEELTKEALIYGTLSWDSGIWMLRENALPKLLFEDEGGFRVEIDIEQLPSPDTGLIPEDGREENFVIPELGTVEEPTEEDPPAPLA